MFKELKENMLNERYDDKVASRKNTNKKGDIIKTNKMEILDLKGKLQK